ncbi:MAG: PEGA domain-containing protein [Candidatus Kentron sp. G]|nr:MAG: PEGA domain-containing protein [Candidatus Kentron sp. G]VFM99207.1 MAG: PEGA domain-containing protein [Candidatus Kentron sp. G]
MHRNNQNATPPTPGFPLQPFLLALEADGIRVRPRDYRRIAGALQGEGPWTRARLGDTLALLLAKDPAQERALLRRFGRFFDLPGATAKAAAQTTAPMPTGNIDVDALLADLRALAKPTERPSPSEPPPEAPASPGPSPSRHHPVLPRSELPRHRPAFFRRVLPWLLGLLLILAMGLGAWRYLSPPGPEPAPQAGVTGSLPSEAEAGLELEPEPEPKPKSEPEPSAPLRPERQPHTRRYRDVPYVADIRHLPLVQPASWRPYAWGAGGLLVLLLGYLSYLYFERRIRLPAPPGWDPDKPRRFSLAGVGGPPAPLLDRDTLGEAADLISYFQSARPAERLDVPATIQASLAAGGVPTLCFHRRRRIRTVLILRDRRAETGWNHAAQELTANMARHGVPVILGTFQGSPERFRVAGEGVRYLEDLEDLEDERGAVIVLIFSDGHRLAPTPVWRDLRHWPQVAWLDDREPNLWPADHPARRHGIPLYTADGPGIRAALVGLLGERGVGARGPAPERGPVSQCIGEPTAASLALALGDALAWAEDCAVLQPVSLGLADALRCRFHGHLPPTRLARLLALPGVHRTVEGIVFPPPVRRLLKQGFVRRRSPDGRRAVLGFLREELDKARPVADGGLSELDWQSRRALLSLELGEPAPELGALAQTPLKTALATRLADFGAKDEPGKIPFASPPHPEALPLLARLPENPLGQPVRGFLPPRPRQWAMIGSLGVLLLAMVGLAGQLLLEPESEPEPEKYTLTIQPTPSDAKIRFQHHDHAYQPGMKLAAGRYDMEVAKTGFERWRGQVVLDKDTVRVVALKPVPPEPARLVIRSEVGEASVFIDGRPVGPTGPEPHELTAGEYTVRVESPGYRPFEEKLQLAQGERHELPVQLAPKPARLVIRSNISGDAVFIDDEPVGPTGPEPHQLAHGEYTVRVEKEGFEPGQPNDDFPDW